MPSPRRDSTIQILVSSQEGGPFAGLARDVCRGLTQDPKELPPKYFYDALGAALFEEICELPEYYLTRTEFGLLQTLADEIVASCRPTTLVEFGPGNASKTRILLDAMGRAELLDLFVPIDVSADLLHDMARRLGDDYPGLRIHSVVGDFEGPLPPLPAGGRRLVLFLGSTIGNLTPPQASRFLADVAGRLGPQDRFLLGTDLVKDAEVLERAYNDPAGVTAAFNRNILSVINRHLGAAFDPGRFQHLAFYRAEEARIEMHLVAREAHRVWIPSLDLTVEFAEGESIRTEISCKYTRAMVEAMLEGAGLRLLRWDTDEQHLFALSLSEPIRQPGSFTTP